MAEFFTLAQIRTKIKEDLDLEQEQFITSNELLGYINEAIDDAESIIHGLYADYFLTQDNLSLVAGQATYNLPSNIYANKIRRVLYDDSTNGGVRKYRVQRLKQFDTILNIDSDEQFRYVLRNDGAGSANIFMEFYPTPPSNLTDVISRWYIRNANRLALDTDICDIPEFINYVYAHVRYNVATKEKLGQDITQATQRRINEKILMEGTLHTLMDDEDNEIMKDLTSYQDFYYNDESFFNF